MRAFSFANDKLSKRLLLKYMLDITKKALFKAKKAACF